MKIALLGNMNNNNYSLLRYFRDKKIDTYLLLFDDEADQFKPINDTFGNKYFNYIFQLSWGSPRKIISTKKQTILNDLKNYNILIGAGLAPAYLYKAGLSLDVFIPYGADLDYYTKYNITYPKKFISLLFSVYYQRKGVSKSKVWHLEYSNDTYDKLRNKLRGNAIRWSFSVPYVYINEYKDHKLIKKSYDGTYLKKLNENLRNKNDLILISPTRHVWGGNKNDPNQKGTNYLIKGLNKFKAKNPSIKFHLIMYKYGKDYVKTKKLIKSLNLNSEVTFLEISPRKDVIFTMLYSDIVCGEFEHSFLSAGVYFEALCIKKSLLSYRKDKDFLDNYNYLYPILNAKTPSEICDKILEYCMNTETYKARSEAGYEWYRDFVLKKSMEHYLKLFSSF